MPTLEVLCAWFKVAFARRGRRLAIAIAAIATLAPATALSSPPSDAFRYTHDADGRLKAAIDPEGDTAVYNWDPAGNLLSIDRHPSSELSITQLSPAKGEVGETIEIEGTGFSPTPESNTVKFNGTAATVTAATSWSLTVKVPAEATTGTVTVKTPEEGPVTSAQAFTVASSMPSIASLSPTIAAAGEEVTIAGSNFEPTVAGNTVRLNGSLPELVTAAGSSIKFKVPSTALGGKVSVATPEGSSAGPDLFVPPAGISAAKVSTTDRIAAEEPKTTTISTSEAIGLLLIDGEAGQRFSLPVTETAFGGTVTLYGPSGASIGSTGFAKGEKAMLGAVALPTTGTYTLVVDPNATQTGSAKLTAYIFEDITGSISTPTETGGQQKVSIPIPGQKASYSVSGTAGQMVSLKTSNSTFNSYYDFKWYDPSGNAIDYFWWLGAQTGFRDPVKFQTTGTYKLLVWPESQGTGSVDLTLWDASDITGQTITPSTEGGSANSTIKVPGQRELITFEGIKDLRFNLFGSEGIFNGVVTLYSPSGSSLGTMSVSSGSKTMLGAVTLPTTGTYTLVVNPNEAQTGSVKLTAYAFEDITGSISTPTETGVSQKVSIGIAGQKASYSVSGTAGQMVSLKTSNSTFNSYYDFKWYDPSGKEISFFWWLATQTGFKDPVKFPTTGTYKLLVWPEGQGTGSVDLTLWNAPDITGQTMTPTSEGASLTSAIEVPGQRELITFEGTAGERLLFKSESAISGSISITTPGGSSLSGGSGGFSSLIEPVILPTTGTYTILVDPNLEQTGNVKLTGYVAPEDITDSIAPTEEGTKYKVSIPVPTQNALYSVKVAAGQKISLKTLNSNFSGTYRIEWLDPSGKVHACGCSWAGKEPDWFWAPVTFANAGTYTIFVDPSAMHTGSVDLMVWDASDRTGQTITPATEGGSVTSSVKAPGQIERITFEGTASQLITLKAEESTIASGTMKILKPDGSQLSGSEFSFSSSSSAKKEVTLPTTGTYTVVVDPNSENTGSVKATVYLGSHVSWLMPDTDTYRLVAFSPDPGGQAEVAYSDIPAKAQSESEPHPAPGRIAKDAGSAGQPEKARTLESSLLPPSSSQWEPKQDSWFPPQGSEDRGWFAGQSASPWLDVPSLQPAIETTALAGQALEVNGLPLAGMRVSIEGTQVAAETDEAGRFLLNGAPAGKQALLIDGESIPGKRYGTYEVAVELSEGKTTELDYTIWLTPLDEAGDLNVASPTEQEVSLKTPRIPGLEVKIPAGTTITDAAGRDVRDLNITAIPVDRAPFPLPPFVAVPVYFTVQPGRAYLSKGARFVYPNWAGLAPGQRVDFWNYDPEDRGWYVYGRGTVTPDGEQVAPDPGVRVWEFSGAMATSGSTPPAHGPNCHQNGVGVWQDGDGELCGPSAEGGDPVDLYTGLFTYEKTDLTLPDEIPIDIERTYRPNDSNSYSFGIGTTSFYDLRLWPIENYKHGGLVLPDGGLVDYERTSPGSGYAEAVYESKGPAGVFADSTITYKASPQAWELKTTGGTTYRFGWFTPLMEIEDRHGNLLTIKRTTGYYGDITQITSPHGRWAKFTYDGSGRVTEIVDNGGRKVKYAYSSGRLTKVEGVGGRTTEYEYDKSGRMSAITNARGNKYLTNAYDANGRVETQTTGDGATFDFDYELDKEGEVEATTITDPRGNKRVVEFNADGFPVSETEAPGSEVEQTRTFERQPGTGLILSETDPLGRETAYEYDGSGNVTEITRLAGTGDATTTEFEYEPGTTDVTAITDPNDNTTEFEYGPDGELLKRIDALGNETTYGYNAEGELTSVTNAEEEKTKLSYEHGDLVAVTDPLGRTTSRFVDALGRLRAITSPDGQRTTFSYNDANELTGIISPSGAETSIGYDKDGDVVSVIDPRENETTMEYDAMDRPIAETNPLEDTAKWDYDKAGNLIEAISRNGDVSEFDYDELGRLAKASFGVSGESAESTIEYEYDDADRVVGVDDSASGEYVLGYDELDRLTEVSGPSGSVAYEYDDAGRRTSMTVPGLGLVDYNFDDANRLTQVSSGETIVDLSYDDAGRLNLLTLPNGMNQIYDYDKAGQITSIAYIGNESQLGELNYSYDANGRTEAIWGDYARLDLPKAMESAKYNTANQLTERGEEKLSYDAEGNLIEDDANEYEWDARGQLSAIEGAAKASFAYDPFGRRTSKTLGETMTEMLHDGANVVQEYSEEELVATVLTGLLPDQAFARTTEEGPESFLTDRLGSVIALADAEGEIDTTYSYEPFGAPSTTGEPSDNPFQFTGRENDGTGLQYNRARYYSPSAARFISQDPAGFAGSGTNLYWYANGNPLDFTDPSGECFPCMPDFDPFGPVRDAVNDTIDEIGDWPSEAPGVASDLIDFADVSLTKAELLRVAAGEALGAALCGFATRVAMSTPDPRWKAAAAATCLSQQYAGATELGIQAADDD